MKIKEIQELKSLAEKAGKTPCQLGKDILSKMRIIEDTPENFGEKLQDCILPETPVKYLVDTMIAVGITPVKWDDFENFVNLTIMGDGDCPECGGELEMTDREEMDCGGDGWNTPMEKEIIRADYECRNCGHIMTINY